MVHDLLIKGGHVFDPGQGIDGALDIAISDGRFAAIAADIPESDAARTIVVKGDRRYVTPGLIDIHTHTAFGVQSPGVNWQALEPDVAGVLSGVTTIVDCGTSGAYNFGVVPTYLVPTVRTRMVCLLNVASNGLLRLLTQPGRPRGAEVLTPDDIDIASIVACVNANPGLIGGIKLRLVGPALETMGTKLIDLALEAARELGMPLMTHIGDLQTESASAPGLTDYLISKLQPGDIITHICTGHSGGLLDTNKRVLSQAWDAKKAGVVMDPASGRSNFSWDVCRIEADQGFEPDTISTDISLPGRSTTVFGLMEAMSRFMACGYGLDKVVRMTTANAAKAAGLGETAGAIKVGATADLTILDDVTGRWLFHDTSGTPFTGEHALVPVQTVRAGQLISPEWGPHPWGWLPPEA